jgi:hypothetical protein
MYRGRFPAIRWRLSMQRRVGDFLVQWCGKAVDETANIHCVYSAIRGVSGMVVVVSKF